MRREKEINRGCIFDYFFVRRYYERILWRYFLWVEDVRGIYSLIFFFYILVLFWVYCVFSIFSLFSIGIKEFYCG